MSENTRDYSVKRTFDYWTKATLVSLQRIWGGAFESVLSEATRARLHLARAVVAWHDSSGDNLDVRHSLQREYVAGVMAADELDRMTRMLPIDSRLSKVLSNVCRLYSRRPERRFSELDDADKRVRQIYRTGRVDARLGDAHILAKEVGTVAVRPVWRRGRMRLQILTPDRFDAVPHPEDPGLPGLFYYPFPTKVKDGDKLVDAVHLRYWTAEETWTTDKRGEEIAGSREPNVYGRIPFTFVTLREQVDGNLFGPVWFEGMAFQISDNLLRLSGDRNLLYNSFVVVMAINLGLTGKELALGAGRILKLEDLRDESDLPGGKLPPNLQTLDLQSAFILVEEFRERRKKEFLRDNHLPAYYWDDAGQPPSGVALRIQREELTKESERDEVALEDAERDLFDQVARSWNRDFVGEDGRRILRAQSETIPEDLGAFSVDYGEEPEFLPAAEQRTLDKELVEEGTMPIREYYARWSGDDTVDSDEGAIKKIKANRATLALLEQADVPEDVDQNLAGEQEEQ